MHGFLVLTTSRLDIVYYVILSLSKEYDNFDTLVDYRCFPCFKGIMDQPF